LTIWAVKQLKQKESAMTDNDNVFVFIGAYGSTAAAWEDYDSVKELHSRGVIGTYDAAIVNKDTDGKVHVLQREKPTEKGAWTGVAIGAVVGILFPPTLIASAAIGAAVGGLAGHLWHGMSRSDMKDLGEALDAGTASLVVVGKSGLAKKIAQATARAQKRVEKELKINAKDFEKALAAEAKSI
jgi:uncharacterized membrane protein